MPACGATIFVRTTAEREPSDLTFALRHLLKFYLLAVAMATPSASDVAAFTTAALAHAVETEADAYNLVSSATYSALRSFVTQHKIACSSKGMHFLLFSIICAQLR